MKNHVFGFAQNLLDGDPVYPKIQRTVYGAAYQKHLSAIQLHKLLESDSIAEQLALRDDTIADLLALVNELKKTKDDALYWYKVAIKRLEKYEQTGSNNG